jgi:Leucine-rich repeat (LRR) protein
MLESLPAAIADLKNLKSLLLHKNRLRTLPTEIIALKCLTEVCIVSALVTVSEFLTHLNQKYCTVHPMLSVG